MKSKFSNNANLGNVIVSLISRISEILTIDPRRKPNGSNRRTRKLSSC
jgi:hypothetical protein